MLSRLKIMILLSPILATACAHQAPPLAAPPPAPLKTVAFADPSVADAADRAVERSVREILELAGISTFDMFVRSRGGEVNLSGVIPNAETGARIVALTKQLKRVKGVRQEFSLSLPPPPAVVSAENNSGFPFAWIALAIGTLLLGFYSGSRRARRKYLPATKPIREASLHEVSDSKRRAS